MTPNSAKGRTSYDSTSTDLTINFFNRNVSEYPTEAGGPKFDLIPVNSSLIVYNGPRDAEILCK